MPSKPKTTSADVEKYLAGVPEPARTTLEKVRATIRAAAPAGSVEAISYGMPAFKYKGSLVGYAAFKDHCSFFVMSPAVLDAHQDDVAAYQTSKGTLQFPLDQPLPARLVKKLVAARVAEVEARKK